MDALSKAQQLIKDAFILEREDAHIARQDAAVYAAIAAAAAAERQAAALERIADALEQDYDYWKNSRVGESLDEYKARKAAGYGE